MADKKMTFGIGIKTTYDASGINRLKADLTNLSKLGGNVSISSYAKLPEAIASANTLKNALSQAYNPKLGTATIDRFNRSLANSGTNLQQIRTNLHTFGTAGDKAFLSATTSLMKMNTVARSTSTVLDKMFTTFKNTITWGMSSAIWNGITGSLQKTYSYIKDLDTALNDIRIVTGKSNEEMAAFAKNANDAAKALGTTTRNYAEGSLIYYQQGLNDEEVKTRTDITAKTALVTGQSMDQVSEQLTAVWNGYKVSAEEAELYVDRLAAVAATTASDLEELSTGMSKVASAAANLGVTESQLSAILATTISVTRQAPENVGTAYKTIFARISDIQAGLDAETTLGNYTGKMAEMGVNVLDATGNLRDMGEVIEEIGQKWSMMSREQQIALAHTMAGTRQYNNLVALFDNWDKYVDTLNTANNAAGTLAEQHGIALDSIKNRLNVLKATWEDLYGNLIEEKDIKSLISSLTEIVQALADLTDSLGGLKTILPSVIGLFLQLAAPRIGQELGSYISNFIRIREEIANTEKSISEFKQSFTFAQMSVNGQETSFAQQEAVDRITERYSTLLQYRRLLTNEEKASVDELLKEEESLGRANIELEARQALLLNSKQKQDSGLLLANQIGMGSLLGEDTSVQDRVNQYIAMGSALQTIGSDLKGMGIVEAGEELNILRDSFENALSSSENFQQLLLKYPQAIDVFDQKLGEISKNVEIVEINGKDVQVITEEGARLFNQLTNDIENAGKSLSNLATSEEDARVKTNLLNQSFKDMKTSLDIRAIVQDVTLLTGAFTSVGFALRGISSLIDTLKDETLTSGQKTVRIVTSIGFLLPSLMNGVKNIYGFSKSIATQLAAINAAKTVDNALSERALTVQERNNYLVKIETDLQKKKTLEMHKQILLAEKAEALNKAQLHEQRAEFFTQAGEGKRAGGHKSAAKQFRRLVANKEKEIQGVDTEILNAENGINNAQNILNKGTVPSEGGGTPPQVGGLVGLIASNPGVAAAILGVAVAVGALVAIVNRVNKVQEDAAKAELEHLKTLKEDTDTREENNKKLNEAVNSYQSLESQLRNNSITQKEFQNQVIALTKDIEDQDLKLKILRSDYEDIDKILEKATWKENEGLIGDYNEQIKQASDTMVAFGKKGTSTGQDLLKWFAGGDLLTSFIPIIGTANQIANMYKGAGDGNLTISKSMDLSARKELSAALKKNLGNNVNTADGELGGIQIKNLDDTEKIVEIYEGIDKTIQENAHLASTQTIKELTELRDNMKEAYDIQKDAQDKRKELRKQDLILEVDKDSLNSEDAYFKKVSELASQALFEGLFNSDQLVEARIWANTMLAGVSEETLKWSKDEALADSYLEAFGLKSGLQQKQAEELASELTNSFTEAELKYLLPMAYSTGVKTGEVTVDGIIDGFNEKLSEEEVKKAIDKIQKVADKNKIEVALSLANEQGNFNSKQIQDLIKDIEFNYKDQALNVANDFNSMAFGNQMLTSIWTANQMALSSDEVKEMIAPWEQALEESVEQVQNKKNSLITDIIYSDATDLTKERYAQNEEGKNYYDADGNLVKETVDYTGKVREIATAYVEAGGDVEKFTVAQKELYNELVEAEVIDEEKFNNLKATNAEYESYQAQIEELTTQIETAKAQQIDWNEVLTQSQKVSELYNARIDDIQAAYKTLSTAEKEWNLNEGFTVDTLQSLLKMSPKYLDALEMEGNQFKVNTDTLNEVARAQANVLVNEWEMSRASEILQAVEGGATSQEYAKVLATHTLAEETRDLTSAIWAEVDAKLNELALTDEVAAATLREAAAKDKAAAAKYRHIANNVDLTKDDKSSKSKKKDTKEYRDEFDRYWEYLKAIEKVGNAIEELNKKEKNLYGTQKIASLKNKNDLLKQQVGTYKDLYEEQKREQAELIGSLGAQGMTFNAEGEITNYAQKTSEALAAYNDAVRKYNSGLLSETAFDTAEKEYEKFKKEVERYDKLYYSEMKDTIEKVEDINREVLANNLEAWEIEIKLKIDWASLEREWADFLHNIEKDFTAVYEDLGSELENIIKKATTYTETDGTIETDLKAIKDVMAEIDKIEAGNPSDMFESMTQAQEKLKELNSSLIKDSTALKKLWEDAYKAYLDGIEQLNDKLENQMDKYEQIDKELAHQQKLIGLLYGDTAYSMMDVLYRNQEKNQLAEIHALKTQRDLWEKNWKAAEEGSKEQLKFYDLMIDAQNNLNSSVEEYIKLLQTDLANAVSNTLDKLDKTLTNGLGIDRVKEQWDDLRQYNEGYFDDNQRVFEIEKFGLTVEQKIADANAKNQKSLKAFQEEELKRLKEKQNLSEYDIKTAEYRLELLEKEMALEDAQNAKNSMKLTRDTNGNWTYQYVADEEDVAQKQLDLVKTAENYYNYASEMHDKALEKMMDAFSRYKQTVQEIANDVTLTEEEKNERIAEATKEYEKYTERLMEQSNLTAQDMAATSAYALTLSVKTNLVNINDLSEEQQDIVAKTIELNKQDFESLYGAVEENDRNILTDIENMLATTVPEWTTAAQEMADKWNADDGNSVKNLVNNAIGEIRTELSEYSMELDELERTADVDFGNITSYIEEATGATEELTDKIDELCNDNDLENLKAIVDDVAESWNNVKGAITDAVREVEIYLKKLGEISNIKVNTLGASAGWSDTSNFGGKGSGLGGFETDTEQQWWSIGADGSVIVGNANSTVPFANISKDADTAAKVEWGKHYGNAEFRADRMDLSDSTMRGLAALIGMSTEEATRIYRTPENLITNLKLEEKLLQLIGKDGKMSQYLGFATGGYTGEWAGGDGRLAMLHSKEIVLNEADTANFLSAISMLREIASFGDSIEESIMSGIYSFINQFSGGVGNIKGGNTTSKQNIFNINAPITSTASTDEIQNAILQLPNLASQYVSRTNGSF